MELYDLILEWLAKSRQHLKHLPHWETRLEHLRLLAFGMQTREGGRERKVELDEAAGYLAPTFDRNAALWYLRVAEADGGIVAVRGDAAEFAHLTFQEYLAAKQLDDADEVEIRDTLHRDRRLFSQDWIMVLRFLVAMRRKTGQRATERLFKTLLDGAAETSPDRLRAIALSDTLRNELTRREGNGEVTEFRIADERFAEWTALAARLFDDPGAGAGLDAKTRAAAAEVWERLGDVSRLPLLGEDRYWVQAHGVTMGRYPVTVFEYGKFVESAESEEHVPRDWDSQRLFSQRPVTSVSWHDAVAYCEWASARSGGRIRLATSEEWEMVASGRECREYPWGDEGPDEERANFAGNVGRITPVGLFPRGSTPEGIADLAGNVWEWTSSEYERKEKWKVVRGGSYIVNARILRAAFRDWVDPEGRYFNLGFRCVRD